MNIKVGKALSVVLLISLLGCGSSGESSEQTKEEQAKEPELKEVEISLDNWQDYFDISYQLNTEIADPETTDMVFYDEDIGKEYHPSYSLMLCLKDEYKDKLDPASQSSILISCDIEKAYYDVTVANNEMAFGDYHPSIVDETGWTGREHGMLGWPPAENLESEGYSNMGYEVADDGIVVHISHLTNKGYNTTDILNGIELINPHFSRETYENGAVWNIIDIKDESIFAVVKDRKIDWNQFEGKLYFYE